MDFNTIRARLLSIGSDMLNVAFDKATGVMLAQTGDAVNGTANAKNAEIWQQPGFSSIPTPCQQGASGAQCVAIKNGDQDVIIAVRDTRAANAIGNLNPGESIMYATGATGTGAAKVKCDANGNVTIGTTDTGQAGGNAVMLQVGIAGLNFVAPWGKLKFDQSGFHVFCNNGPSLDMTIFSGLPGPLGAMSSAIYMKANSVKLGAAKVMLGLAGALGYQPVVLTAATLAPAPFPTPLVVASIPGPQTISASGGVFVGTP